MTALLISELQIPQSNAFCSDRAFYLYMSRSERLLDDTCIPWKVLPFIGLIPRWANHTHTHYKSTHPTWLPDPKVLSTHKCVFKINLSGLWGCLWITHFAHIISSVIEIIFSGKRTDCGTKVSWTKTKQVQAMARLALISVNNLDIFGCAFHILDYAETAPGFHRFAEKFIVTQFFRSSSVDVLA